MTQTESRGLCSCTERRVEPVWYMYAVMGPQSWRPGLCEVWPASAVAVPAHPTTFPSGSLAIQTSGLVSAGVRHKLCTPFLGVFFAVPFESHILIK